MPRVRKPFAKLEPEFCLARNAAGRRFRTMALDECMIYVLWWAHSLEARTVFWGSSDEDLRNLARNLGTSLRKFKRVLGKLTALCLVIQSPEHGFMLKGINDLHIGVSFSDAWKLGTERGPDRDRTGADTRNQKLEVRDTNIPIQGKPAKQTFKNGCELAAWYWGIGVFHSVFEWAEILSAESLFWLVWNAASRAATDDFERVIAKLIECQGKTYGANGIKFKNPGGAVVEAIRQKQLPAETNLQKVRLAVIAQRNKDVGKEKRG